RQPRVLPGEQRGGLLPSRQGSPLPGAVPARGVGPGLPQRGVGGHAEPARAGALREHPGPREEAGGGEAGREQVIRVPAFLVVGGGEAGAFYVRQLRRAAPSGALATDHIAVIGRVPACRVRAEAGRADDPHVRVETADWAEWLAAHLRDADPRAHLVPYHWAPHLLLGWLEDELDRAGASTERGGEVAPRGLPFETTTQA